MPKFPAVITYNRPPLKHNLLRKTSTIFILQFNSFKETPHKHIHINKNTSITQLHQRQSTLITLKGNTTIQTLPILLGIKGDQNSHSRPGCRIQEGKEKTDEISELILDYHFFKIRGQLSKENGSPFNS